MSCAIGSIEERWLAHSGRFTYEVDSRPVDNTTLWDVASLTKIVATTNVAMTMYEQGAIDLEDRVQRSVLEFVGDDKHEVTIRHLLEHTSGLPAYGEYTKETNALEVKDRILRTELESPPGTEEVYSCLGFVALAEVLQRRTRLGLDKLFETHVTRSLGLADTSFKPHPDDRARCAPTERTTQWRKNLQDLRGSKRINDDYVQGEVHDPIAFLTGGISGNAGLFSNVADLSRVATAWLNVLTGDKSQSNGQYGATPFLKQSTLRIFTSKQPGRTHALGFDTKSTQRSQYGTNTSDSTFGHTGFTGARLWVDPELGLFGILLSNRIHPSSDNEKIKSFSTEFFDEAIGLVR